MSNKSDICSNNSYYNDLTNTTIRCHIRDVWLMLCQLFRWAYYNFNVGTAEGHILVSVKDLPAFGLNFNSNNWRILANSPIFVAIHFTSLNKNASLYIIIELVSMKASAFETAFIHSRDNPFLLWSLSDTFV